MARHTTLVSLLCTVLPLVGAQWTVGQAVDTTSGKLTGTHAKTNTDVSFYGGIPYAQPPVGDLRWASPQKYSSSAARNATAIGPGCPANALTDEGANAAVAKAAGNFAGTSAIYNLLSIGNIGQPEDEDCLTLNIWTKPQSGEKSKAVMVWLYGGGFQFGATNNPAYNGEYFVANNDVVLVSVNYRTNVFGFPGLPGVSGSSQNPGLEDQRLAVEWVRDNIAAFGGDVDRITLFGESAGGASIDMYSYAYVDDPIIAGGISESGTARSFFDPVKTDNLDVWYNMSSKLGCGDNSTSIDKSLACLRKQPMAQILNATIFTDPLLAVLGDFQPTSDNKTVFADYKERGAAGNFSKTPLLIGNNNYEAGVFKFLAVNEPVNITDNQWDFFNLVIFTCPIRDAAQVRSAAGSKVWRFRYFAEFANTRLTVGPNSGAYHTSEIPIVFQTDEEVSGTAGTDAEVAFSNMINTMWADFAKDPENALSSDKYDLPQFKDGNKTLIYLGLNNGTERIVAYNNNTDASCDILQTTIQNLGGINKLLSDPIGFSRSYGGLADQLHGFVGIGDSNHADAPFGPPPYASNTTDTQPSSTSAPTSGAPTSSATSSKASTATTLKTSIKSSTAPASSSAPTTSASATPPPSQSSKKPTSVAAPATSTKGGFTLPSFGPLPSFGGLPTIQLPTGAPTALPSLPSLPDVFSAFQGWLQRTQQGGS